MTHGSIRLSACMATVLNVQVSIYVATGDNAQETRTIAQLVVVRLFPFAGALGTHRRPTGESQFWDVRV